MYSMGDSTWSKKPKTVSDSQVLTFSKRLEEYLEISGVPFFEVILHGGEPLLVGKKKMESILRCIHDLNNRVSATILLVLQTNGVLLDEEWLRLFEQFNCRVGISHDGLGELDGNFRLDHNGKASGLAVEDAIRLAHENLPDFFDGCLAVVDPSLDATKLLMYFHQLGVKKLDLLLPDQNYVNRADLQMCAIENSEIYTDYMIETYRAWRTLDDPEFDVRFFRQLMLASLGQRPSLDSIGTGAVSIFTVDTDGAMEVIDTYRICGDRFTESGQNIETSSFIEFSESDAVRQLLFSEQLPPKCESCQVVEMCGGGYRPHRYNGKDFMSESVYCDTLFALCNEIRSDVAQELSNAIDSLESKR